MKQELFVSHIGDQIVLFNSNGQQYVVTDREVKQMSDDDIIRHFQTQGILKITNGRG